ncbi:DNA polymerase III subunit delta [Mycoplasma zalophidermidis]|uniref:DNA polymerase III subunit delta n=1 Tax=Mycoplasma zalophidermidis TaxID=398174 RepID=A0ABS6DSV8_9MOLU|nr:DNA polymerase III subunit delta [Mycoplasma zalophidermidis]MBU4689792.1 DNA polymerase III subunit delta [Mycoplasma zalophidermidis]MBU4693695.1 DNA polymerase III subunit delta [Mycoplasma zalophidermidis]
MYLIYGQEKYFVNEYIQQIIKANNNFELVNFYYADENKTVELTNLIGLNSLFQESRIIVVYDCPYFENKISKEEAILAEELAKIIEKNTQDTVVFVNTNIVKQEKIANNIFTKYLMKFNPKLLFANTLTGSDLTKKINQIVHDLGGQIDNISINALLRKVPNDLYLINLELIKLVNLNKIITVDMIEKTIGETFNEDVFGFSNSFESNNFNLIWIKYKEKINEGVDISLLIAQASQLFILANEIYCYSLAKKNLSDLADDFKLNFYRVKKVYSLLTILGIKRIQSMIKHLAKLDREIKSGQTDPEIGFERFLINYFR